jgi:hypothetical protein
VKTLSLCRREAMYNKASATLIYSLRALEPNSTLLRRWLGFKDEEASPGSVTASEKGAV